MGDESGEVHPEDDNTFVEKNRKRTVKTLVQIQALEKFYIDHKYPTEAMKAHLAEAVGLTEKQISGWFCHRRLKDKKSANPDNDNPVSKQDRSGGAVVQDRGSGHKQDSCCSTKQNDDERFLDAREVESGRLMMTDSKYCPSGSNSEVPNNQLLCGRHFDDETSTHLEKQVKTTRSGPSGYLKVKGRVENSAITALKRQMGKHYRDDGPPLGVEFDPLPPCAFDYPVRDRYYATDVSRVHQDMKFDEGRDFEPSVISYTSRIDAQNRRFRHPIPRMTRNPETDHGKTRERSGESRFNRFDPAVSTASHREIMGNEYTESVTTTWDSSSLSNGHIFKRFDDDIPPPRRYPSMVSDNLQKSYPAAMIRSGKVIPGSRSEEDEGSAAETSSSVD